MSQDPAEDRSTDASPPSDKALEHARHFLAEAREELSRAESKAAVLLAAQGVVVGALLAALMTRRWTPFELRDGVVEWTWWLGIVCLVFAVVCLAAAVWPKIGSSDSAKRRPAFFGDFARFEDAQKLAAALRMRDEADALERAANQVLLVSRIVRRKYRFIRASMVLLGTAAALCLGSVLVNALLP